MGFFFSGHRDFGRQPKNLAVQKKKTQKTRRPKKTLLPRKNGYKGLSALHAWEFRGRLFHRWLQTVPPVFSPEYHNRHKFEDEQRSQAKKKENVDFGLLRSANSH